MERIKLIDSLASVYQQFYDFVLDTREQNKLNRATSSLSKAMTDVGESLVDIAPDVLAGVHGKLESAIAELEAQKPELPSRKVLLGNLVGDYSNAVSDFTAAGGKGFYDVGVSIYVTYDQDVDVVRQAISALSNEHDVHIFVDSVKGNSEGNSHRKAAHFGVVLPSSKLVEFEQTISEFLTPNAMFEYQHSVRAHYYFISPLLNNLEGSHDDALGFLSKLQAESSDKDVGSWFVENMFTLLGCARYEFRTSGELNEAIELSLSTVTLYNRDKGEIFNGVMPTCYYYSESEIKQFGLDASGFDVCDAGQLGKVVNMVDELSIFAQNKQKREVA